MVERPTPSRGSTEPDPDDVRAELPPSARPTVDDMGEWSFPASDPPASWTWEPKRPVQTRP